MHFLERLFYYFQGRYGMDEFSKFLLVVGLSFGILANFVGGVYTATIGIAYGALRPMSKEIPNRQKEFRIYMNTKNKVQNMKQSVQQTFSRIKGSKKSKQPKKMKETSNQSTIITCPNCNQKLRVPKNKYLNIRCKACNHSFTKET